MMKSSLAQNFEAYLANESNAISALFSHRVIFSQFFVLFSRLPKTHIAWNCVLLYADNGKTTK